MDINKMSKEQIRELLTKLKNERIDVEPKFSNLMYEGNKKGGFVSIFLESYNDSKLLRLNPSKEFYNKPENRLD